MVIARGSFVIVQTVWRTEPDLASESEATCHRYAHLRIGLSVVDSWQLLKIRPYKPEPDYAVLDVLHISACGVYLRRQDESVIQRRRDGKVYQRTAVYLGSFAKWPSK